MHKIVYMKMREQRFYSIIFYFSILMINGKLYVSMFFCKDPVYWEKEIRMYLRGCSKYQQLVVQYPINQHIFPFYFYFHFSIFRSPMICWGQGAQSNLLASLKWLTQWYFP